MSHILAGPRSSQMKAAPFSDNFPFGQETLRSSWFFPGSRESRREQHKAGLPFLKGVRRKLCFILS